MGKAIYEADAAQGANPAEGAEAAAADDNVVDAEVVDEDEKDK